MVTRIISRLPVRYIGARLVPITSSRCPNNWENSLIPRCYHFLTEPMVNTCLPGLNIPQNLITKRYKSRKRNKNREDEDDDSEDEGEDEEENPLLMEDIPDPDAIGRETLELDVRSLRLDSYAKTIFNISRNRVEEAFYKGELYINGERPGKKSVDVTVGDELDLVKNINSEDPSKIDIKRAIITKVHDIASQSGRLKVTVHRWNDLVVDTYTNEEQE